ncbi:MAG: hypothetical protein AAF755_14705 [Pseudomonadota bacterium]
MTAYLSLWWVWICIALVLGVIELLAPAFIFLGFAIGAVVVAVIVAIVSFTNIPALLALFATLSLIAWVALKLLFRRQSSGARVIREDINEG